MKKFLLLAVAICVIAAPLTLARTSSSGNAATTGGVASPASNGSNLQSNYGSKSSSALNGKDATSAGVGNSGKASAKHSRH